MEYTVLEERIKFLKMEVKFLEGKYKSMENDGGRFNTTIHVLQEVINDLESRNSCLYVR